MRRHGGSGALPLPPPCPAGTVPLQLHLHDAEDVGDRRRNRRSSEPFGRGSVFLVQPGVPRVELPVYEGDRDASVPHVQLQLRTATNGRSYDLLDDVMAAPRQHREGELIKLIPPLDEDALFCVDCVQPMPFRLVAPA